MQDNQVILEFDSEDKLVIFAKTVSAMCAGAIFACFLTLQLKEIYAQDTRASERLAVVEAQIGVGKDNVQRLEALAARNFQMIQENQLRINALSSELATIRGIGIGFGSIIGFLQLLQMLVGKGVKLKIPDGVAEK